jgi:hypothetical protein
MPSQGHCAKLQGLLLQVLQNLLCSITMAAPPLRGLFRKAMTTQKH